VRAWPACVSGPRLRLSSLVKATYGSAIGAFLVFWLMIPIEVVPGKFRLDVRDSCRSPHGPPAVRLLTPHHRAADPRDILSAVPPGLLLLVRQVRATRVFPPMTCGSSALRSLFLQ
jgi:hypothetical protein